MTKKIKISLCAAAAFVALLPFAMTRVARGSDHADTPDNAANPGQDLSDVYVFPSPNNPNNVVLVMNASPLIPSGDPLQRRFDPNVLYQFKIDNTGDSVEDLVIQARFDGSSFNQQCHISGPAAPAQTGVNSTLLTADPVVGTFNTPFTLANGAQVFCGTREDSFFFDLNQFFAILPDRATPVNNMPVAVADANTPKSVTFNNPGTDFLSSNKYNVLSIVIELPKTMLTGINGKKIGVWCTTSK